MGLLCLALLSSAAPANACRVFIEPAERVRDAYRRNVVTGSVLARVVDAKYVGPAAGDVHPWRATANVERALLGSPPSIANVTFTGGNGSASCDPGYPVPKSGDLWVAYFYKGNTPGGDVVAYPQYVPYRIDPLLGFKAPSTSVPRSTRLHP